MQNARARDVRKRFIEAPDIDQKIPTWEDTKFGRNKFRRERAALDRAGGIRGNSGGT
jgi:hypothetical protein